MSTYFNEGGVRAGFKGGNVLCVTDLSQQAERSLNRALRTAEERGMNLEIIHVVDLGHARSMPDAQMEVQFILESLAMKLKMANKNVTATLLFGCPEKAIAKRANDCKAALIAFAPGGAQSTVAREILMARVRARVTCPVIDLATPEPSAHRVIRERVVLPPGLGAPGLNLGAASSVAPIIHS